MNGPAELALIEHSFEKLRAYVEHEDFRGYDPYDTLTSSLPFRRFGKLIPVLALQFQKRNPVNIRALLGIKKQHNPKALGLFLYGYSKMQKAFPEKNFSSQIHTLFELLKQKRSNGYSGYCWGYNFDWASSGKYIKAFSPNIVVTAFIARGIYEYYKLTKDIAAAEILKSIGNFILKDLPRFEKEDELCFSYTTLGQDYCYNASLLAAEVMCMLYELTSDKSFKEFAIKAGNYVVRKQHSDGHWNYSIDEKTGKERAQIDFHQGYVIDSLKYIMAACCPANTAYQKAINKGLRFYREEQFFPSGQSKWRLPKIYPVEIHNQSQGIITFCRESEYVSFAVKIAEWTVKNMQSRKGFFYYRKLRSYTNRISYMRWSQAWMFVSLSELQLSLRKQN